MVRRRAGREESPSVGCIDSRSVKGTYRGRDRGLDGGTLVKGWKRHVVADTHGLLLAVRIRPANRHDGKAVPEVLRMLKPEFKRLKTIYTDGGYRGDLRHVEKRELKCNLKITLRSDKSVEFKPLPKRRVLERTFAWFEAHRRLSRDYEFKTTNSENMLRLTMIALMVNRLY